ncbi:MAG: hypothetical protein V1872_02000 [bacterium]
MKYGHGWLAKLISVICIFLTIPVMVMLIKTFYIPLIKTTEESFLRKRAERDQIASSSKFSPEILQILDLNKNSQRENKIQNLSSEEEILKKEHFHNIDDTLDFSRKSPTVCLTCHGSCPHNKNKESRSLYNMHTVFCACEVCHLRNGKVSYKWFDSDSGRVVREISNRMKYEDKMSKLNENGAEVYKIDGNYNAKIIPCVLTQGEWLRLDRQVTEKFKEEFTMEWSRFTPDQQAKEKAKYHAGLTDNPVSCKECHNSEKPYLNFTDLGYPKHLCDEFVGTEVAGMVVKYKSMKMTKMFTPESIIENKIQGQQK